MAGRLASGGLGHTRPPGTLVARSERWPSYTHWYWSVGGSSGSAKICSEMLLSSATARLLGAMFSRWMIRGMRMASSVRLVIPHSSVNIRFSWSCVIRQKMRVREGRQRITELKCLMFRSMYVSLSSSRRMLRPENWFIELLSRMWERSRLASLQRRIRKR